jgi:hypothetical protein
MRYASPFGHPEHGECATLTPNDRLPPIGEISQMPGQDLPDLLQLLERAGQYERGGHVHRDLLLGEQQIVEQGEQLLQWIFHGSRVGPLSRFGERDQRFLT